MNRTIGAALLAAFIAIPSAAADDRPLDGFLAVHTALPMGTLATDVDNKLGFGFSFGVQQPLTSRWALRAGFSWTGYRVDDRNLWSRAFASMLDADYREERLVLRSYAVEADLRLHAAPGGYGAYFFGGAGVQRARLYLEDRYVDRDGNEAVRNLASWPAIDTPIFSVGAGYQGHSHAFLESRFRFWRYRGVQGYRLLESPLHGQPSQRDAFSFTVSVGVRF